MKSNSYGENFRIHTFGESHGPAMGVVIDGCPAGVIFHPELLRQDLLRRKPGHSDLPANQVVSPRNESDEFEILSGILDGKTLGTPIAIVVRNHDQRPQDYQKMTNRQGHADDVWFDKFQHIDLRGGGRASARETVSRVIAGAIAKMFLQQLNPKIQIYGFAQQIGPYVYQPSELQKIRERNQKITDSVDQYSARFVSQQHQEVKQYLLSLQQESDSVGGAVQVHIENMSRGLGQPVFHKLKSDLAAAMLSVGATCGFELGEDIHQNYFKKGSEFHSQNHYGGIRGGISTGEEIRFRILMKPTSSISDVAKKGRHDPCLIPRAVPIFEAMTALVLANHVLAQRLDRV